MANPLTLMAGKTLPMDQLRLGRTLYDVVNGHMRYSKEGTGWGLGDCGLGVRKQVWQLLRFSQPVHFVGPIPGSPSEI